MGSRGLARAVILEHGNQELNDERPPINELRVTIPDPKTPQFRRDGGPGASQSFNLCPKDGAGWARMARRQLKVVKLIEPDLCLECRFAQMA
jgi:hypothetical protein